MDYTAFLLLTFLDHINHLLGCCGLGKWVRPRVRRSIIEQPMISCVYIGRLRLRLLFGIQWTLAIFDT